MPGLMQRLGLRSHNTKRVSVCNHLNAMGVQSRLADTGRPEELFRENHEYSIGLIHLSDPYLEWANVAVGGYRGRLPRDMLFFRTIGQPLYYRIWYGLYDPKLKMAAPSLKIHSRRLRSWKFIGKAVDVDWHNTLEQVTLAPMTDDPELKSALIDAALDVEVMGFPDGYWILSNREAGRPPTPLIWKGYQAVAKALKISSKNIDPDKLW